MPEYLYIIREEHDLQQDVNNKTCYLKIGVAGNPKERLKQLQTANPRLLLLMGVRPIRAQENRETYEASIHSLFSEYRVTGEWFRWRDEITLAWMPLNMLRDVEKSLSLSSEDYFYELGRQVAGIEAVLANFSNKKSCDTLHDSLRGSLSILIEKLGGEKPPTGRLLVMERPKNPISVFDQLSAGYKPIDTI